MSARTRCLGPQTWFPTQHCRCWAAALGPCCDCGHDGNEDGDCPHTIDGGGV